MDIFERFVQITPRSEPGTGAGLGLAICKSIVGIAQGPDFGRQPDGSQRPGGHVHVAA